MPYEPPPDPRAARSTAIWRWVSFALVALLVALLAYLGYVGYAGSGQLAEPPAPSRDCRTPGIAFGWNYEAVNYDAASDAALAEMPDPTDCDRQGEPAGPDLLTPDGLALAGWYVPSASGSGPAGPTVVLAHGHGANKSGMLARASVLHADYNLVLFDFRNHGQSEDALTTVGIVERADLRTIIDWLEGAKGPSQIAVLGVSMGGATAANEAVGDPRVDALVLESTHATLANAIQARLERAGYPLSLPGAWSVLLGGLIRSGQDMSAADPVQAVDRLRDRPVLIIGAGRDDAVGASDADDLLAAALEGGAEAELQVCEEAGHGGSLSSCEDGYGDWVLGFLRRALAPS